MGINRIKLQAGSSAEMAAAQKAKTSDPALDAIRQQLFGQDYIQDIGRGQGIAQYYSGFGLPSSLQFTQSATSTPTVDTSTPAVDTGGGGGGAGITSASAVQPIAPVTGSGANTPFEQNLIDQGAGVQIAPGQPVVAPGEMPVTQAEMDAFNQIQPKTTAPSGDVFAGGDYSNVAGTLADPTEKIDYTQDPEGFGDRVKTALSEGKDLVTEFGQGVADQITKLKDQGIDLGRLAGRAIANAIIPGLGFALDALPERDPRQTELENLYDVKDGTIQSGLMQGYNPVSGNPLNPTFGLQDAYDDRIGTIENTLKDKYNMTDAEIADVRAGSYTGDVDTNLLDRLTDLDEAKAKEKDRLDLFSGDVDDRDQMLEDISLQQKIDKGIQAADDDKGSEMLDTSTGVNPFADIDTGAGEFDVATQTTTGGPPSVLNPEPGTISGTQQIPEIKDYVETEDLSFTDPNDRSSIIDKAQELGIGNVDKHFENNSKLAKARDEGLISDEDYNILGGYDVAENVTGGSKVLGAGINLVGSPLYNLGQAAFDLSGETEQIANYNEDGSISYTTVPVSKQKLGDIPGTVARNTLGGAGIISLDQKNVHDAITKGNLDTPEGIAAVKNQIEMSRYKDPIMGMVDQPTKGTLAGRPDLPDLMDEFDMTAFDEPTTPPTPRVPDFISGRADRDPAPTPKKTAPTPRVPDFISGGRDDSPAPASKKSSGPPSMSFADARAAMTSAPNYGPPSQSGGGGGGGGGGCFLKGTPVTMADGSTKAVEQVDLGDNVAKGGKVFAVGKFLINDLYDYKGIKVSGSHMVSENGNWVRVEDSKHGKALGDNEHTVYVFGAENRRILINDILFTDYFEVNEQEKLSEGDKFFDNWKIHAKVDSDNNVNVLNAN